MNAFIYMRGWWEGKKKAVLAINARSRVKCDVKERKGLFYDGALS